VTDQHDEQQAADEVRYDESYDEQHEAPDEQHEAAGEQHEDVQLPADPPDLLGSGDPRVAAAVARLDELGDTPPAEHVEVYEDAHRVLQDALADAARSQEQAHPGAPRQ
jgi:hypothetical protein